MFKAAALLSSTEVCQTRCGTIGSTGGKVGPLEDKNVGDWVGSLVLSLLFEDDGDFVLLELLLAFFEEEAEGALVLLDDDDDLLLFLDFLLDLEDDKVGERVG